MRKHEGPGSEDMMQSLLNRLPDLFFILDEKHRISFCNKSVIQTLGISNKEIHNREILSFICQENHTDFLNLVKLSKNEQDITATIDFLASTGECIPTDTHVSHSIWKGRPANFVIANNRRDRLLLMETIERERKAYALIAEAAVATETIQELCKTVIVGLVETLGYDLGTVRILDKSQNILRLEAVIGLEKDNVIHDVDLDDPNFLGAQVARRKEPIFASDVHMHPIAKTKIERIKEIGLESIIFWPLLDENGNLLGVCNIGARVKKEIFEKDRAFFETVAGMFGTVLDRRLTTIQLKASQDQFVAFANHIPGPIYIKDHESRLLFANRFMTEPSGAKPEDWIGKNNYELFPNKIIAEEMTKEDQQVFREGLMTKVTQRRMISGEPAFFRTIKFPIHLEGSLPLLGGVSIDITEQRIAEQKMEAAKARAEFFTDLMSHDLNNMHQGIMSSLELILVNDHVSDEAEDMIKRALAQVQRSVKLIGNVRRFSFLQNQVLELQNRDLHMDIVNAIDAVKESFPEKDIKVKINFASEQYSVTADEFLFDVFYNLIHNSAKYDLNDPVHILVNAFLSDDEKLVKVEIEDNGPGMHEDLKKTILSKLEDRKVRQKGIGLTLVYQIIERYKGKIQVEDKISKDPALGTRFSIYLPTEQNK